MKSLILNIISNRFVAIFEGGYAMKIRNWKQTILNVATMVALVVLSEAIMFAMIIQFS